MFQTLTERLDMYYITIIMINIDLHIRYAVTSRHYYVSLILTSTADMFIHFDHVHVLLNLKFNQI